MNKLLLGLLLAAVVAAVVVWQISDPGDDPSSDPKGANPSAAGGNNTVGGGAMPQGQDAKLEDLVPALMAAKGKKDRIIILPCDAAMPIAEDLRAKKTNVRVLGAKRYNPQYYVNEIIPTLRQEPNNYLWVIFDNADEKVSKALDKYLLTTHRIAVTSKFGSLTLVKVVNEILGVEEDAKFVYLKPIVTKRGTSITDVQFAPSGDYLVQTEKTGIVRWRSSKDESSGIALKMTRAQKGSAGLFAGGESGLLAFAFHPKFASNQRVFLHYNYANAEGKRRAIVSEWQMDSSRALSNERVLFEVPQPRTDHNGGSLIFGPKDGFLYIPVGDGGDGKHTIGRAPPETYRGKIHRIDVDSRTGDKQYGIPADNPFLGHATLPPETFAWGFRNPWRLSFTLDGRLIVGDIGENVQEEITFVVGGRHHGWPYFEGTHIRNEWKRTDMEMQPPLLPYGRTEGMSVIGGIEYRGDAVTELIGKYVFADFINGTLWAIELPAGTDETFTLSDATQLGRWPILFTTFGQDVDGNLFIATNSGRIYRIEEPAEGQQAMIEEDYEPLEDAVAQNMFGTIMVGPERTKATAAQVELGRLLYADKRLSTGGDVSCATCHALDNYGQDGKQFSTAAGDSKRNTPTTFNADRQFAQLWDYRAETVEQVALKHGNIDRATVAAKLTAIPDYVTAFDKAFPGGGAITTDNVGSAIGGFLRMLNTRSRWDDYLEGKVDSLTLQEKRGLGTFVAVGCITCHQFRGLGGSMSHKLGLMKPWTGHDRGHIEISGEAGHEFYFKVPALTNIEKTAPYLHDGSVASLDESVRLMADIQLNRKLKPDQVKDIVAFLKSLTGPAPAIAK